MSGAGRSPCPGCGVALPDERGPVHRYMESSPACWARYGELLAREYSDARLAGAHRLTVDAYAVQHPGRPSPQAQQSVAVHLVSLCAVLERGVAPGVATKLLAREADRGAWPWLEPPVGRGALSVLHALAAATPDEHVARVTEWARAAWQAWCPHHEQVRAWADRAGIA